MKAIEKIRTVSDTLLMVLDLLDEEKEIEIRAIGEKVGTSTLAINLNKEVEKALKTKPKKRGRPKKNGS